MVNSVLVQLEWRLSILAKFLWLWKNGGRIFLIFAIFHLFLGKFFVNLNFIWSNFYRFNLLFWLLCEGNFVKSIFFLFWVTIKFFNFYDMHVALMNILNTECFSGTVHIWPHVGKIKMCLREGRLFLIFKLLFTLSAVCLQFLNFNLQIPDAMTKILAKTILKNLMTRMTMTILATR